MPNPMYPLSENGGRHTESGHVTDTNHFNQWPIHNVMDIQPCGIQPRHWLAWIPASGARQHGMVFLCTQLNSLVDVLKVNIRTAVCVL